MLTTCVGDVAREKGVTISELAERAKIAYGTAASMYRGGVARVDLETLARIAKALGVPAKDLLREVEDVSSRNELNAELQAA